MSTSQVTPAMIQDPAIQARARVEYQKQLKTDPSLQNLSEAQGINQIAAKLAADEIQANPDFAVSFNKEAQGDLAELGDVSKAEEQDANTIMQASQSVKPDLPVSQTDEAMQHAQQADSKALKQAQDALASLQEQQLPPEVLQQYADQVGRLEKQVTEKWSGQAKPEDERNKDLLTAAYKDVFNREPDVGGMAYHLQQVQDWRKQGLDDKAIAAKLKDGFEHSEEYHLMLPSAGGQPPATSGSTPAAPAAPANSQWQATATPPKTDDAKSLGSAQDVLAEAAGKISAAPAEENDQQAAAQYHRDQQTLNEAKIAMQAVSANHGDAAAAGRLYENALAAFNAKWNGRPADETGPAKRGQAF